MKFVVGACLVLSLTAGCSQYRTLEVRNGPQPIHPSEYVNGSRAPAVTAPVAVQPVAASAPIQTIAATDYTQSTDTCGAAAYQRFVGGPSSAVWSLDIAPDSRHYGPTEVTANDTPTRLNFTHSSGDVFDAIFSDRSTVTRVFCG